MKVKGVIKVFCVFLSAVPLIVSAQEGEEKGTLRGDLMVNSAFYIDDPRLGQFGTNTTQYKNQLSSAEAWMFLNYNVKGYDFNLRYDLFHNSPLLNPVEAYTSQGLPFFNMSKEIEDLKITVGSFYDQFGSGILFRAYEDRVIGLDFAMTGVKLEYIIKDKITLKAFTGKQKNRFALNPQVVQGINMEGGLFGEKVSFTYGFSAVKRTLDFNIDIRDRLAPAINSMKLDNRFVPRSNVYGGQVYGALDIGNFGLTVDLAAKTPEATFDFNQNLINEMGTYAQATLTYSTKGLGITLQGRYLENFSMRTDPYTALSPVFVGTVGFLTPVNRQNTYRLPARYSPNVQEVGEIGLQGDISYAINRSNVFNVNYSYIYSPHIIDETLYRELFITYQRKFSKTVKGTFGFQTIYYNQKVYEGKAPSTPNVQTNTPFVELLVKLPKRRAIRTELQYLQTDEDLGDFAWALLEYTIGSKYSITLSDMVNTAPREDTRNPNVEPGELVHYPTVFLAYTYKQTRFTAGYIKQVEGIVCNGGVCRLEPAFSGVRFGLTTNF